MGELLKSAGILACSAAAVHLFYLRFVRPQAEAILEAARAAGEAAPREWVIVLKDWEQEICLALMIFCAVRILMKMWALASEQYLFRVDMLEETDDGPASPGEMLDDLEALPETGTQLVETLKASLRRYRITGDVQNTSDAIQASVEGIGMQFEADNAMIRYVIWAIPSIGFVGTVRGIGQALTQADEALAGNIAGMTADLGTAFNSTLVALLASLPLMLLLHALQRAQDRRLVDIRNYCERFLVRRISR